MAKTAERRSAEEKVVYFSLRLKGAVEGLKAAPRWHPCYTAVSVDYSTALHGLREALAEVERERVLASLRADLREGGTKGALAQSMLAAIARGERVVVDGKVVMAD